MAKSILSLALVVGSIGYLGYIDWKIAVCVFVFVWGNNISSNHE